MAKQFVMSGYLPGHDFQGISALYDEMVASEERGEAPTDYVVVTKVRAHTVRKTLDGDAEPIVTVRIVAAEVLREDDADAAAAMLRAEHDRRVGPTPPAMIGTDLGVEPDAVADPAADPRPVENVDLPEPVEPSDGDLAGSKVAFTEPAVAAATDNVTPMEKPKTATKPAARRGRGRAK